MAFFPLNDGSDGIESAYPYSELWNLLIEKTAEVGHMLTPSEARADPKFVDLNSYAIAFGGRFSDWAKEAWQTITIEQEEAMGKKWDKEKILEAIKKFCEENKKLPTSIDFNNDSDMPSYYTVYKTIGKKEEWVKLLYGDEKPPFEIEGVSTTEASPGENAVAPIEDVSETSQESTVAPSEDAPEVPQEPTPTSNEDVPEIPQEIAAGSNEDTPEVSHEEPSMASGDESEVEPLQAEESEAETPPASQTTDVEVVDLSEQAASNKGETVIELKISLPGREVPISLRLSF